jgi:hypothetical protein
MLGALVVAVDGVGAAQLEVDVPIADRHARVVRAGTTLAEEHGLRRRRIPR